MDDYLIEGHRRKKLVNVFLKTFNYNDYSWNDQMKLHHIEPYKIIVQYSIPHLLVVPNK